MKTTYAPADTLGGRLQQARYAQRLLIREVAAALQISRNTYTNIEQGHGEPGFFTVVAAAQLLGVSIDYLAGLTDDPTPASHRTAVPSSQAQ